MKLLFYCTKSKWQLFRDIITGKWLIDKIKNRNALNGKVVCECDFEVSEIELHPAYYNYGPPYFTEIKEPFKYFSYLDLLEASCLQDNEILKYLGNNGGYAIHIKNLNVFDKPKELNDYSVYTPGVLYGGEYLVPLKNVPQNMAYCYEYVKTKSNGLTGMSNGHIVKNVIVSIRPEWLCKILNGEKTIEVRKKVLKEMIK